MVSQDEVRHCDPETKFTSSDEDFSVGREGIVALSDTVVPSTGRTFSVWAQDASGHESKMEVHLVPKLTTLVRSKRFLKRAKRVWRPPPFNIMENAVAPFPKVLDHIGSNSAQNFTVYYTASGPGVNMEPVGLLSLDKQGLLKVHKAVDRETYERIQFTVKVYDVNTHKETDKPLTVTVIVDDENDNKPEFKGPLSFRVTEKSKLGTMLGQVNATDKDKPNTLHTKISFSLQTGDDMFAINRDTGFITVKSDQLDRETKEKHLVTVQIKDMDGGATGLSNTATATIMLDDINDNPPTFTKTSYAANVDENTAEKLILRIPVEDRDLKNSPNWKSKFVIMEGNENENFRMETDPKTNEGLLYITKALDYEKTKNVQLKIQAQNQVELVGTKRPWLSVPVTVAVANIDEGPEFIAPTISFTVKENTPNGTVIGTYTALDPETKSSNGIKYYKVSDPASWVFVDMNSGALKVANTIDREASFLQGGAYNITVKAIDATVKSATGTVILVVEDENDHMPELPTTDMIVCEKEGQLGSVIVNALDGDQSPYAEPFHFKLPEDHNGNWEVKRFNDTAAVLQQARDLPVMVYEVPLMVTDLQGQGKPQVVKVKICHCRNGACVAQDTTIDLGSLGILALLLPLLLLLLLGVLLALFCVTKHQQIPIDDGTDGGGILLKSNIEVPGEEVVSVRVCGFSTIGGFSTLGKNSTIGGFSTIGRNSRPDLNQGFAQNSFSQGQYSVNQFGQFEDGGVNNMAANSLVYDDHALNQAWQNNGQQIHQKLMYMGMNQGGDCYAEDVVHSYGFEGVGSAAGSVGCCSDIVQLDDQAFLNTLGPKFNTLAYISVKK
ncbi:unnamed protein product [Merluccius merluccius]